MTKPRVTLATAASMPNLYPGESALLDALSDAGVDPRVAVWNDPQVDWSKSGVTVVRSVVDYAADRPAFLDWARSVPKILNPYDVLEWNTDKRYLADLTRLGLPTIDTTWLSAERGYSKHQLHGRFPVLGDFVIKPAVSSGVRDIGRYSALDIEQRQLAMALVQRLLGEGRDVMIQRYHEAVDAYGEHSLIYFNGLLSHAVEKKALLVKDTETGSAVREVDVHSRPVTDQELGWSESIRKVVHEYVRERVGHDEQFLFNRVDLVPDGEGSFIVMEVALVDADLYLGTSEDAVRNFADAISVRVFW